ncbi:YueI family protein [Heyndrickxia oleronia]|uniref:YueI family protein n=1 Tax=Heyndrickxia oleronia TaxID=38875 RepID=UPI00203E86A5|nr:YueI family protein [Heyndrickxia oleronia]MCM3236928.1 YueI family protein [Heyndrickxia oleronia]
MSRQPNIDDYLQKGMYGDKQIKPDEKRKFLGTFRERIIIALKKSQVMENKIYYEIEEMMLKYPNSKLLLNGDINYPSLSKYIQIAKKRGNPYSIITNNDSNTSIGLVLALDYAINIENIYVTNELTPKPKKQKKASFWSSIKSTLNRRKK